MRMRWILLEKALEQFANRRIIVKSDSEPAILASKEALRTESRVGGGARE